MAPYTPQHKADCIEWFIEEGKNFTLFHRRYNRECGRNATPPDHKSIWKWYNDFKKQGPAKNMKTGNQWVLSKKREGVAQHFAENPHTSTRKAANVPNLPSRTTIQRILNDDNFHPYKMQLHQKLKHVDKTRRIEYAILMLDLIENSDFLNNVLFSDEAHFYQHGMVNRHNFRYWAQENPHWYREQPLHSPRWTVWAAIGRQGIVGPYFFEQGENVDQHNYLAMLRDYFLTTIREWRNFNDIVFMQDGAPAHYARSVRDWLEETFPHRWMGRGTKNEPAPFPWPAYSPDLCPLDFFLWGYIKNRIYSVPVQDMTDLRARIEQAFRDLPQDMVNRAIVDFERRLRKCIDVNGESVEE